MEREPLSKRVLGYFRPASPEGSVSDLVLGVVAALAGIALLLIAVVLIPILLRAGAPELLVSVVVLGGAGTTAVAIAVRCIRRLYS